MVGIFSDTPELNVSSQVFLHILKETTNKMYLLRSLFLMTLCIQFCAGQGMDFSQREIYMSNAINKKFILFTSQADSFSDPLILSNNEATSFQKKRTVSHILNREVKSHYKNTLNTHLDFAPAILSEAKLHSPKEHKSHFALHMEFAHEFQLGKIGIEPYFEFSIEQEVRHLGVGIQLGIPL